MKLLWTLLVCVIVAPLPALSHFQKKCGRHFCVTGATCIDGRCVCNDKGSGFFYCYGSDKDACMLYGDPHFENYNGEKGLFPLPCRHRITKMLFRAGCLVEVIGTAKLVQASRAYEVGIEVYVKKGQKNLKIILDSDKGRYLMEMQDGSSMETTTLSKEVYTYSTGIRFLKLLFMKRLNQWIINSYDPHCGFQVIFRPSLKDPGPSGQTHVPGVLVKHKKKSKCAYKNACFPGSLCSVPGILNAMVEYQQKNKLDSTNLAVIHAWLTSGVDQESNKQCQDMMDDFGDVCTTKEMKSDAVNICGPMFDNRNRGCVNKDGKIVPYFITCVKAVCDEDFNELCELAESTKACDVPTLQEHCT